MTPVIKTHLGYAYTSTSMEYVSFGYETSVKVLTFVTVQTCYILCLNIYYAL
jgi:hypothetical protein